MVPYDLEVPDYSGMAFGLSGVVLTSRQSESFATANPDSLLESVLPHPPVVTRTFNASETLTSFVEAYSGAGQGMRQITFSVAVRDAETRQAVFSTQDRLSSFSG